MKHEWVDPKKQFSKRLARWTAVFWFVYMAWLGVVLFLAPEAGLPAVYLSVVSSVVMVINIYQYNSNSKLEKTLFMLLNRTELELKFGGASLKTGAKKDEPDPDEEGESNG